MKITALHKISIVLVLIAFTTAAKAQNRKDSTAIENILQEEIVSWNKKDAKMYSRHFAADGTFTNIIGMFFTGYDIFLQKHEEVFKTVFRGTSLQLKVVSIKFADAGVAVVETMSTVSGFSADGPPRGATLDSKGGLNTRLLQVMVRTGDDWKIIAYHNVDIKQGIPIPETAH